MNAPLWRVFLADLLTKVENWFITKYGTAVSALSQSAWAANNSVDVGMTESCKIVFPELAQPGNEQIYTTQPAWDFREGQTLTLGGTTTISNVEYPIPSLVRDTDGNDHVVFPLYMWLMDGHYVYEDNTAVAAADEASVQQRNGNYYLGNTQVFPTGKYSFVSSDIIFRHNCNYFGGGLDGHLWQEVATSGTWTENNDVQVTVNASEKPGTFCRINGTDSGIVTAVSDNGDDTYTLTLGCLCGLVARDTTITKVELYKPLQG